MSSGHLIIKIIVRVIYIAPKNVTQTQGAAIVHRQNAWPASWGMLQRHFLLQYTGISSCNTQSACCRGIFLLQYRGISSCNLLPGVSRDWISDRPRRADITAAMQTRWHWLPPHQKMIFMYISFFANFVMLSFKPRLTYVSPYLRFYTSNNIGRKPVSTYFDQYLTITFLHLKTLILPIYSTFNRSCPNCLVDTAKNWVTRIFILYLFPIFPKMTIFDF